MGFCVEGKMLNSVILEQYSSLTDEKLIEQIKHGNADLFAVLISRYDKFLAFKVAGFDPDKTQHDDYMQEAILAFFTAVKTYDAERSSFRTYLNTCVTHSLISFKRKMKRQYTTDSAFVEESPASSDDTVSDPLDVLENQESVDALMTDIKNLLSGFELKALTLYLSGSSYDDIAKNLETTAKSVDNALQRVRCKLKNRNQLR